MHAAFESMPERPEETELRELFPLLEGSAGSSAQFKTACAAFPNKLFSLKMPGGFAVAASRQYLDERWGLAQGRQDSIFLRATTAQPASRLPSPAEAKAFFDKIVQDYAQDNGLDLSAPSAPGPAAAAPAAVAAPQAYAPPPPRGPSPEGLAQLFESQKNLREAQGATNGIQKDLDNITAELGTDFILGIQGRWSKPKVRKYDSYWNWAMQDLYQVFYGIMRGELKSSDPEVRRRCAMVTKRSNKRTIDVMQNLAATVRPGRGLVSDQARETLLWLIDDSKNSQALHKKSIFYDMNPPMAPKTLINMDGHLSYSEVPRTRFHAEDLGEIRTRTSWGWGRNENLTTVYRDILHDTERHGPSLQGKTVLLTGAGRGSIGFEVLRGLLVGGARVIVTTSRFKSSVCAEYRDLYKNFGARGSQLVVAPFNQGSAQDTEALAQYIFDPVHGLGWDLDYAIPFAAISDEGEVDELSSKSELAHRVMLINLLRLVGAIKKQKVAMSAQTNTASAQIILPLSPNHGAFGNDGLYAESKIGLEALANKWHSESWSSHISICGAIIGWVRGTGLMSGNDRFAMGLEEQGIRTYTVAEMANRLLALMDPALATENEAEPLYADISGGMNSIPNLREALNKVRSDIDLQVEISTALSRERDAEEAEIAALEAPKPKAAPRRKLANLQLPFPQLPDYDKELAPLSDLQGMVDLERVVVVTGFSEVGPHGNARTRWEMEAHGEFSLEGCVEMAWIMGLIKHHNGPLEKGQQYIGWVDAETKKPVHDSEIKKKYESYILEHVGIRLIEPELDNGYDPDKKQFLQEIVLETDMPPFTAPQELAEQFKTEHGDNVDVATNEDGEWMVRLRKGATLMIPKAMRFDRNVAGQIPKGWDAKTYGIPEWIVQQVDRVTLFALVSTVESLLSSGIVDPYELYNYLHVSEVGTYLGSSLGGQQSLKAMYRYQYLDKPVQKDILQETFINTTAAWVNMLLLSSSGPIKSSVGACATSIESLESGYESIMSGKAKMALVGGHDDMCEEVAYEFGNMNATANTRDEETRGREPREMSRPMTSTRSGFVESQGSGLQIITTAALALKMGLPVHGIVAWAGTSSDKIGRSVPAPGKGVLTNAREQATPTGMPSPLLELRFRKRQLQGRQARIREHLSKELRLLEDTQQNLAMANGAEASSAQRMDRYREYLQSMANRQEKEALDSLGSSFWQGNSQISPIRGALAVWGLTIDDLDFASLHGTSTVLNDLNETTIIQKQLRHLGRTEGNTLFAISQKYLTGHSKGAAGAWMLNGCLQVLDSGLIPGNRNADNIGSELEKNDLFVFPQESIQTTGLKACSITSFGFGQKGAQAIVVHPRYLFATLTKDDFQEYKTKAVARQRKTNRFFQKGFATNALFVPKEDSPYDADQEAGVLLNPDARALGGVYAMGSRGPTAAMC